MSQSKKRAPIQLAGIQAGTITEDGEAISFTLEAHKNGQLFTFSVPHEAIGEIVSALIMLADRAAEVRPKTPPTSGEHHRIERVFPMESYLVSGVPENGKLVLTLYARSIEHSVLIERADAQQMGEALLEATKRIAH